MVQKEIKKKTKIYATTAVLSAIILVDGLCFRFSTHDLSAKSGTFSGGHENFRLNAGNRKLPNL